MEQGKRKDICGEKLRASPYYAIMEKEGLLNRWSVPNTLLPPASTTAMQLDGPVDIQKGHKLKSKEN